MNKVILIGRLGADPNIRFLPDGGPVANFNIATDESYKNKKGEKIARTEWHRIVAFSKLAEVASDYLTKGRLVAVEGKLRTRKWDDKDGVTRYTTEINAMSFRMLDSAKKNEDTAADAAAELAAAQAANENGHPAPEEDVPF